ncbi:phage tail tape measure protein [Pseudomonas protegens]|uniref:Phage tail tape measure protein n=1 Tax=Pseudomonas protegens TaxID=380021 RepID=A0A7G8YU74_9PSED|nr:phage tail tape measure protein [Pseudomonas protegens]QNH79221.1 phage tail tape measure protein [Pseudomonas protegens]QNL08418.1 phage tail tape measure protein [Pseudomonas protegens]
MANKLVSELVVIGTALSSTWDAAFKTVEGRIKQLEQQGSKARVLEKTLGQTLRLQDEWKKAHDTGAASAAGLLRRLEESRNGLRQQGIEVHKLRQEYQALGNVARGSALQARGLQQVAQGKADFKAAYDWAKFGVDKLRAPVKISADYQALIRDMAIKAGVANQPQEAQLSRTVIQTSRDTGMARNDVAALVSQMMASGMSLDKAQGYAGLAAKFAVGQGASVDDTAKLLRALELKAGISDPKVMEQALEAIALQGQAGNFEAADMARLLPALLKSASAEGLTGMEAVSQLGSMLQVQMNTAASPDEAAGQLQNWIEKIGSSEAVKAYEDAGIDYQASLNTGIQKGMSSLEASFALAMRYVRAIDPAKAAKMAEAQAQISKETDPAKAKAMLEALEESLRTGDLFTDMQIKAALLAQTQGRQQYEQVKKDSLSASGVLARNLAERREASKQLWAEAGQAIDEGQRVVGQALQPATDLVAKSITVVVGKLTELAEHNPSLVQGVVALGAAYVAVQKLMAVYTMGKGLINVLRGGLKVDPKAAKRAPGRSAGGIDCCELAGKPKARKRAPGRNALGIDCCAPMIDCGLDKQRRRGRGGRKADRRKPPARVAGIQGGKSPLTPSGLEKMPRGAVRSGVAGAALKGAGSVAKGFAPLLKGGAILSVLGAGFQVADTYLNAKTQDEKAEGYGEAAGNLAGAAVGAAAGAAIGSVVPVIGTVIGGLVGGALGAWGGSAAGGALGKKLFGSDDSLKQMPAAGPLMMRNAGQNIPPVMGDIAKSFQPGQAPPLMGQAARSLASPAPSASSLSLSNPPEPFKSATPPAIEQQFSFAPYLSISVQGDVRDPAQLARELEPYLRFQFDEYSRQAAGRQLFDAAHV